MVYMASKKNPEGILSFLKKNLVLIVLVVVLVAVGAAGLVYYFFFYSAEKVEPDSTVGAQIEVENLIEEVGAIFALPQGEEPTIATVSDVSKLSEQEFFARAQNGDKVLIYSQAKKAILYRPSEGRIIEVAPVNLQDESGLDGNEEAAELEPVTIVVYNGTSVTGLTRDGESALEESEIEHEIIGRENASSTDYEKTIVVVLNQDYAEVASEIADVVGGSVEELPEDESEPNADILIILGSDFAE